MIYFLSPEEGGRFIKIVRPSKRPKDIIKMLDGEKYIAVFKCGMIFDSFVRAYTKTCWRHKLHGGRKAGKAYYKKLTSLNIPTEYISFT